MNEKWKKTVRITGVTAATYMVFRYVLPLVAPFVFACGAAILLKPSAQKISEKLRIEWRGRKIGIPPCVAAAAEMILLLALLGFGAYVGGRSLIRQLMLFTEEIPVWVDQLDGWMTGMCHRMEETFGLREDAAVYILQDMLRGLGNSLKNGIMPYVMGNSLSLARGAVKAAVLLVLFVIGVMLFVQELDEIGRRIDRSVFRDEAQRLRRVLSVMGKAYLRTQGVILLITVGICTAGLFLLKSRYYILAGIGLGLLDALPVFGTGTVLVPWAVFCFLGRKWGKGAALLLLYMICYVQREVLEARMLGNRVGLSSLETLISIYAGLALFGIAGVVLGPVGALIVREFAADT